MFGVTYLIICTTSSSPALAMTLLLWALIVWTIIISIVSPSICGPSMGQAEIIFKKSEKCRWVPRNATNLEFDIFRRKSKFMYSVVFEFPYPLSDKYGFDANVAVKRNGVWRPNFFKYKAANNFCSLIKVSDKRCFNGMAKQLNAPEPYNCPLPLGSVNVTVVPDVDEFQDVMRIPIAPYGEYRVNLNVTYLNDVFNCVLMYVDLVPRSNKLKKKG